MKEIVTLQIGGFANFVGSHFWNFQDELLGLANDPGEDPVFSNAGINLDVLYRVGETQQGVATYTPRLLAFDSRGSLGAVQATGSLYDSPLSAEPSCVTTWNYEGYLIRSGQTSRYVSEPIEKNEFLQSLDDEGIEWSASIGSSSPYSKGSTDQKETRRKLEKKCVQSLENHVQYWTDYSKVQFHPLSIYELQNVWYGLTPFEDFGSGRGLLTEPTQAEESQDRLRFFIEECDHLQGLQVLVDDSGGFSGVAADFLEIIADEYGGSPVLLFNVRSPGSFNGSADLWISTVRALHDAVSFTKLSSLSQLTVPIGLPSLARSPASKYLRIIDTKLFHSSAVYGAALSCVTLPFRLQSVGPADTQFSGVGSMDMASLIQLLTHHNRRSISILDTAMPAPSVAGTGKGKMFDFTKLQPLTFGVDDTVDLQAAEALVIQGALRTDPIARTSIAEVVDGMYGYQGGSRHLAVSSCPLAIPLPFPCIFGSSIGSHGEILSSSFDPEHGKGGLDIHSIPMAARMRVSEAVLPYVENRLHNLKHLGLARRSLGSEVLERWGIQKDEVQELCEHLSETLAVYGSATMNTSSDSE